MKNVGKVTGCAAQALPLIIGVDTVYVHTNVTRLPPDDEFNAELYQYDEVQYDKDEYIQLMAEKTTTLEQQLTDTQLALCEIYEGMI